MKTLFSFAKAQSFSNTFNNRPALKNNNTIKISPVIVSLDNLVKFKIKRIKQNKQNKNAKISNNLFII